MRQSKNTTMKGGRITPVGCVLLTILLLAVLAAGLALGALIAAAIAAAHTDDVEWVKCKDCDPAISDGCDYGIWNDIQGCGVGYHKNNHHCQSTCYRPENETESGKTHHWCTTRNEDWQKCHPCVGSSCYGVCETVNDCPALTNVTSDFDNTTNIDDLYEFGKNVSCELNRCVYRFDIARIPGLNNTPSGCSSDPYFVSQCQGLINPNDPLVNCLETTSVCRSAALSSEPNGGGKKRSEEEEEENEERVAILDQDNNFGPDVCIFSFACAPAKGLPPFFFSFIL